MLVGFIGINILLLLGASTNPEQMIIERALTKIESTRMLSGWLERQVHFERFAQAVMVDLRLSPSQQRTLQKKLRTLLLARAEHLLRNAASGKLCPDRVLESEGRQTKAQVKLICRRQEKRYQIVFHLEKRRIVDVTMGSALLSRNYRAMVNNVFRRKGYQGMISILDTKAKEETRSP